jgi:transcriptional regulator GlxA family with amidase domain
MTATVAILAFDEMEVLDFAGPYEVFNVAGELSEGLFSVISIGVTARPVGRGGFAVLPSCVLEDAPTFDILVVPGGQGTRVLLQDRRLLEWMQSAADQADLVISVCTGALVLGAAGLLAGLPATTHHDAYSELAALSPTTALQRGQRFVRSSERVRTSAGVSAGIDLSLEVVEELAGEPLRQQVADEMEWMWVLDGRNR